MKIKKYLYKIPYFILVLLIFEKSLSQTHELQGYVSNEQKEPLAFANIVAKNLQEVKESVFSVTDEKGFYKILLKNNHTYSITISYLGYNSLTTNIEMHANQSKNFILETTSNVLEPVEIVIQKPIIQKGDTTTVNVAHFIKGNEQKLQDIIVNIPGFELTKDGGIFYKGKQIKSLMVEGRPFFDGSTKLGVQNIPSDAVEKIEVLENYNSVTFLRNFSDEDQTIINIKLKENKKKFWFGDIATGAGIPKNYKLANNLFYYSPTLAINSISNVNNIGDKVFTIKDYLNFQGGVNAIFNDRFDYNDENLLNFTENDDFKTRNQIFNGTHFTSQLSPNSLFSSYFIVNNTADTNEEETNNYYENFSENQFNSIKNNQLMLLGKINYDYTIKDSKYWRFQTQLKKSILENKFVTQEIINQVEKNVSNLQNSTPFKLNQNVEFHSKINSHHIVSFLGIFEYNRNHYLEKWSTPDQFLSGILETYPNQNLNQIYENKLVDKKIMFLESKYFWTINPYNQLIINLNSRFNSVFLKTNSFQKLDNNNVFEFSDEFQNLGNHSLFQNELGLYYKWRYKKWIINQGFKLSNYAEKSQFSIMDISKSKWLLLPSILIEYGKKTNIKWWLKYEQDYKLSNDEQKYIGYTINTYRSVNKGNIDLNESRYHVFSTQFHKSSVLKKYYFKFDVKYSFQTQGFIKEVILNESSQINSNIFHLNPTKTLIVNLNSSKQKNKLKFSLNFNFSNLENLMSLNNEKLYVIGNRISYGFKTQTLFKNIPNFDFTYNYITNQNSFISNNKQTEHELNIKADYTFKSGVSLSLENNLNIYDDFSGNTLNYNLFHFKTFYVTKSKLWQYEISAKNILNVDHKYLNIDNEFYRSESYYNTFPSLWLMTITRKF